jgi:Flp pilus assembly protein TadG
MKSILRHAGQLSNAVNNYPRQRGLAIVEFTLILPFLMLWLFLIAEVGRALYERNTLQTAVEAGATFYARHSDDPGTAEARVISGLSGLVTNNLSVNPVLNGNVVTVSANYDFQTLSGNPLSGLLGLFSNSGTFSLNLSASASMRDLS